MKLAVHNHSEEKFHTGNHNATQKHLAQYRGRITKNGLYGADKKKAGASGNQHADMGVASGENFNGAVEKAASKKHNEICTNIGHR